MIKSDKAMAVILFLFSAFMFYQSFSIPHQVYGVGAAGPALFPRIWSVILALLSIILFFRADSDQNKNRSIGEEKYVYFMLVASLAYILLIKILGYLITTFLFSTISIAVLSMNRDLNKLRIITISVLITAGTYFIFAKVLNVFLPMGTIF